MNTIHELVCEAYENWNDPAIIGRIGLEMESRTRLDLARKFLSRAISLDPMGNPQWYTALAFANFRDVRRLEEAGESALTDGIEATNSEYLKACYISFMEDPRMTEELIRQSTMSPDPNVRFALGSSLLWIGRSDEALNILRQTIRTIDEEDFPFAIDQYTGSMIWLRAQGKDIDLENEVFFYLRRLLQLFPDTYNYRAQFIQAHQAEKDWQGVKKAALETLERFPDEETTMFALAGACEKLGDEERAIHWYNRAIGAKPPYARARMSLAAIYERRNDTARAEEIMREIPVAFPEYQMGKIYLAYFLDRIGKTQDAEKIFLQTYERLKPYEKAGVENHPAGKKFLEKRKSLELTVL